MKTVLEFLKQQLELKPINKIIISDRVCAVLCNETPQDDLWWFCFDRFRGVELETVDEDNTFIILQTEHRDEIYELTENGIVLTSEQPKGENMLDKIVKMVNECGQAGCFDEIRKLLTENGLLDGERGTGRTFRTCLKAMSSASSKGPGETVVVVVGMESEIPNVVRKLNRFHSKDVLINNDVDFSVLSNLDFARIVICYCHTPYLNIENLCTNVTDVVCDHTVPKESIPNILNLFKVK